jgi:hypothetical protein
LVIYLTVDSALHATTIGLGFHLFKIARVVHGFEIINKVIMSLFSLADGSDELGDNIYKCILLNLNL